MAGAGRARTTTTDPRPPLPTSDNGPGGGLMAPPLNPRNVPTGRGMTYAALERIRSKQLRMIAHLKRLAGNPPTWQATCRIILGDDWDGVYETLSVAAGSWLIHNLQAGLLAVSEPGDLDLDRAPA